MRPIILTGLTQGKHKFDLDYREIDGVEHCFAFCLCGFEGEVLNFNNYGGIKHLQSIWEAHVSVKPKVRSKE